MTSVQKFIRTYQSWILSIALCIVSLLGFGFGVIPLTKKIIALYNENRVLSAEVQSLANKTSVLASLDKDELRATLVTVLTAVPQDASIATVIATIDGLTGKTGVTAGDLTLVHPGTVATASAQLLTANERTVGGNILEFSLVVSGTLEQVRSFLNLAVNVRRYLNVRRVEISRAQHDVYTAHLTMEAFHAPLPTHVGSVGQEIRAFTTQENELIAEISQKQLLGTLPPAESAAGAVGKSDPFSP